METVQRVSPGMPTQAQISYATKSTLQYNLPNPANLPLGGNSGFNKSQSSGFSTYNDINSRYLQQNTRYNSPERSSSVVTTVASSFNSEINRSSPVVGRSEFNCSNPGNNFTITMPPRSSRPVHPLSRMNINEKFIDPCLVELGGPPQNKSIKPEEKEYKSLTIATSTLSRYNATSEPLSPTPSTVQPATIMSGASVVAATYMQPPPLGAPVPHAVPDTTTAALVKQVEDAIGYETLSDVGDNPAPLVAVLSRIEEEFKKQEMLLVQSDKKIKALEEAVRALQVQLEENSNPPSPFLPFTTFSLVHFFRKIYIYNLRRAAFAHKNITDDPVEGPPHYFQAVDLEMFQRNIDEFVECYDKITDKIKEVKKSAFSKNKSVADVYADELRNWKKVTSEAIKRATDAKDREIFEKIFSEIRKQREDRERLSRSGGRIRSEADLEEIMDGLQEQEMEDKKLKTYGCVPPLLHDHKRRRDEFFNRNGQLIDVEAFMTEYKFTNTWKDHEKEIFKEKFLLQPKNFAAISSHLERKSTAECVDHYYKTKRTENYKKTLRKTRRARPRTSKQGSLGLNVTEAFNGPGVTTRLKLEQIQQQQRMGHQSQSLSKAAPASEDVNAPDDSDGSVGSPAVTRDDATPPLGYEADMETPLEAPPPPPPPQPESTSPVFEGSHFPSDSMKVDIKKKERRKEEKSMGCIGDTSDEDAAADGRDKTPRQCVVCKTEATVSRPLLRSHASQYGLREEDVEVGARVCNPCRCKAVRSRILQCPLPTCPNTKGVRIKRLRSLPCKWAELPAHVKQPVVAEYQVPANATKCCSACFNRLQRRLVALGVPAHGGSGGGDDSAPGSTSSAQLTKWTEEETEALRNALREHGTKWTDVSTAVGPSKTQYQCKTYYFNFRKKLGLEAALQEYNKKHFGEERKPTLSTDEEESGSTTSSCDEFDPSVPDDSDTASAPSPENQMDIEDSPAVGGSAERMSTIITKASLIGDSTNDLSPAPSATAAISLPGNASPLKSAAISSSLTKEDYDSSATETADEGVCGIGENESLTPTIPNSAQKTGDREFLMATVMDEVIQYQLNQPPNPLTNDQNSKSISTIMDQNLVDCDSRQKPRESAISIVNSGHQQPYHEMKETIYMQAKENAREHDSGTLDLSMKKRNPDYTNNHINNAQPVIQQSMKATLHAPSPIAQHQPHIYKHPIVAHEAPPNNNYYHHVVEIGRITKTSDSYAWKMPPNQPVTIQPVTVKSSGSHPNLPKKVSSPQHMSQSIQNKLSPKPSLNGTPPSGVTISAVPMNQQSKVGGSIMHGTPVSTTNLYNANARDGRYDSPILRQITPPSHPSGSPLVKEPGSITQGTPVHQRPHTGAEFYPPNAKRTGTVPASNFYGGRSHAYEQRHQIIMNDYVTSQHMKESMQRDKTPYFYPPTRQGVIQRHNTTPNPAPMNKPASPHQYSPSNEAFNSLVDVAVRQPNLPVPLNHATANVVQHKEESKQRIIIQEGLGDRFSREAMPQERYIPRDHREAERYSRELIHQQQMHDRQLRDQLLREQRHQQELRDQMQQTQQQQQHQLYREQQQHLQQQKLREQAKEQHHQQQQQHQQQLQQQHQQSSLQQQQHQQPQHHQQQQHPQQQSVQIQAIRDSQMHMQPSEYRQMAHPHTRMIPSTQYREEPSRIVQTPVATSTINYREQQVPVKPESRDMANRPGTRPDSSTLTAASLIDAIITHQINQSDVAVSSANVPTSQTSTTPSQRPGDKLFQVFPDPDGKMSPLKQTTMQRQSPDVTQPPSQQLQPSQQQAASPYGAVDDNRVYMDPQAWKLRRVLQQKEMEQHQQQQDRNIVRMATQRAPSPREKLGLQGCPFDYVKNKIVEVMHRTTDDDNVKSPKTVGEEEKPSPYLAGGSTYTAYPYANAPPSTTPVKSEEPTPILSSKYEPLSDED